MMAMFSSLHDISALIGEVVHTRWPMVVITMLVGHLSLVRILRYRRVKLMTKKFGYETRASMSKMTVAEAQDIILYLIQLEFPFVYFKANAFALFKTYGIPSISKLLVETSELSDRSTASKRSADTIALIVEFMNEPPTSERTRKAIARMNYLHSRWQKAGKISDDDMLYTLSCFALEPPRWVAKYEWRCFTEMELCAEGTFWKAIGDAMSIPYDALPSNPTGWRDGLHWFEEIREWSEAYERTNMVPAVSNKKLADSTMDILLWYLPHAMQSTGRAMASILMSPRLRESIMYPKPPSIYYHTTKVILLARKFFVRHLMYPRPRFMRFTLQHTPPDPKTGRLHAVSYIDRPWYVKPGLQNRMGLEGWMTWLVGGVLPGDNGSKYKPQGFKVEEIGPEKLVGKGSDVMEADCAKLAVSYTGGCPFAMVAR